LEINTTKMEDALIVSVTGRIDTATSTDFQAMVDQLVRQGEKNIVLDLEKVEYLSTAGLRAILVAAKKSAAAGGKLCCCSLQPFVQRIFEVCEFKRLIPVFECVDSACKRD
jgi:anti-anti-sigma factor